MGKVIQFVIALLFGLFSLVTYWCSRERNEITGESQHVSLSVEQEISLGLQAAPQMAEQYGGLHQDQAAAASVKAIGQQVVSRTSAGRTPYRFDFHLLADEQTLNAFALPGGQIFITYGLLKKLQTKGQVAGVLAHEVGHVVARHSAEQLAKARLTEGLTGAAAIAMYDPEKPSAAASAAMAALVGRLLTLKYGRDDELEADRLAVKLSAASGYDPNAMIGVMRVLRQAGGSEGVEFFQTHPNPENRISKLQAAISKEYPKGLPAGLAP